MGHAVIDVSDVTHFPEILGSYCDGQGFGDHLTAAVGGRVKTTHPNILGGILANRKEPSHIEQIAQHHIDPIDLIVCNLYPFEKVGRYSSDFLLSPSSNYPLIILILIINNVI